MNQAVSQDQWTVRVATVASQNTADLAVSLAAAQGYRWAEIATLNHPGPAFHIYARQLEELRAVVSKAMLSAPELGIPSIAAVGWTKEIGGVRASNGRLALLLRAVDRDGVRYVHVYGVDLLTRVQGHGSMLLATDLAEAIAKLDTAVASAGGLTTSPGEFVPPTGWRKHTTPIAIACGVVVTAAVVIGGQIDQRRRDAAMGDAKERVARSDREHDERVAAQKQADAEAAASASARAIEQAKAAHEADLNGLTYDQRTKRIADECDANSETRTCSDKALDDIVQHAPAGDREKLKALAASAKATYAKRTKEIDANNAVVRRDRFASDYDDALLKRHMNPDGVAATGASKTTLTVTGWFCSRQFVHDFATGAIGKEAASAGFTRVTCSNSLESWWNDL